MGNLSIRIADKEGKIRAEKIAAEECWLVYEEAYKEGDQIIVQTEEANKHLVIQLDDAQGAAQIYLRGMEFIYEVPFGEKRCALSPKVFTGNRHYLYVREARKEETECCRNLAVNVIDQHGESNCYPHASANVETRGESVFAAKNAIDGVTINSSHGNWPYASWGINMRDDAEFTLEFGRIVEINKIVLYTRADFPHDNWWKQVKVSFSDGSELLWDMEKSERPHVKIFESKQVSWIKLSHLIKADDPSPFPALSQIEVYGKEAEIRKL